MTENMSPKMSPQPIELTKPTLTFGECLDQLLLGRKGRRLEWEDKEVYIIIQNEQLMIFRTDDKKLHPLIVSTGDIEGMDWVLIEVIKGKLS